MPIRSIDGLMCFVRLELSAKEMPDLLARHAKYYPGARELERRGQEVIEAGFEPQQTIEFVMDVCKWGGGDRHIGRIQAKNTAIEIADAVRDACKLAEQGNAPAGVERLRQIHHLGQSFASKQLRFLLPAHAVILDSVIRIGLGYAETIQGYVEFLADCATVLNDVRSDKVLDEGYRLKLRISDIEAAIFAKLQGY